MAGLTSKLTRVLVGTALGAGVVGVILALAGVHSAVRTGLVLFFLAVAPVAAIAGLLRSFDLFARLILAVVTTIALLTIVAVILLSAGLWSPTGELVAIGVITVGCLAVRLPSVQARIAAWAPRRGPGRRSGEVEAIHLRKARHVRHKWLSPNVASGSEITMPRRAIDGELAPGRDLMPHVRPHDPSSAFRLITDLPGYLRAS